MNEIFSTYPYIKQTKKWEQFLNMLGWKSFRTQNGMLVTVRKFLFFGIAKIQRPKAFDKAELEEVGNICKKNQVVYVVLEPGLKQDTSFFNEFGYKVRKPILGEPSILVLDLRESEDVLWKGLSRSGKYGVNRSRREGVNVKFYSDPKEEIIKVHYQMSKNSGKRGKYYVPPYSHIKKKIDAFGDTAHIGVAYDKEDEVLSTMLFLGSDKVVLYDGGGGSDLSRDVRASFALMWESILHLKKLGYEMFDLGGAYDERYAKDTGDWKGFTEFKMKFGPVVVSFPMGYSRFL